MNPQAVAEVLTAMCATALRARQEEDLVGHISVSLQNHVGCDAVIMRVTEHYMATDVVVLHGVVRERKDWLSSATLGLMDQVDWPAVADGVFCHENTPEGEEGRRRQSYMEELGLRCCFTVPIIRDNEVYGQIVYGWSEPQVLPGKLRHYLRQLADYVALTLLVFQGQRRQELDPLTGLLNRTGLRRRWEMHGETPRGAVLFADVDGLKHVNDQHGHLVGDKVLTILARLLQELAGPRAEIVRYGGDEFVVLMPQASWDEAASLMVALKTRLHQATAALVRPVGVSVGAAYWPQDGTRLEELLDLADRRMYQDKGIGNNSSSLWNKGRK